MNGCGNNKHQALVNSIHGGFNLGAMKAIAYLDNLARELTKCLILQVLTFIPLSH